MTATTDRMIMHVDEVREALLDECDRVFERLVDDNIRFETDSFDATFQCDFETAEQCPEEHLYSLPLFSFHCVRLEIRYRPGFPTVVVYRVNIWQEG